MTSPSSPASKRSTTVTLVLVAGVGTTALVLGRADPSQREEDVLVYAGPDACAAGGLRTEADCRRDYDIALRAYPEAAPRYAALPDCESHHGDGHCLTGAAVAASATGRFVPVMAGYLLGRKADQNLTPQPLYHHRPSQPGRMHTSHGLGYCTSWGGRVVTANGGTSSSARVSSAAVRPASFGGFGQTGRAFASHGSWSSGGGG